MIKPYEVDHAYAINDYSELTPRQYRMAELVYDICAGYSKTNIEVAFALRDIANEIEKSNITTYWLSARISKMYRREEND